MKKIKYTILGLFTLGFLVFTPVAQADWLNTTYCGYNSYTGCVAGPDYQRTIYQNNLYYGQPVASTGTAVSGVCTISNLYANINPITPNTPTTLVWNTNNCTSATISNVGGVGVNGSYQVRPTVSTIYVLNVAGPYGADSRSVQVVVDNSSNTNVNNTNLNNTNSSNVSVSNVVAAAPVSYATIKNTVITTNTTKTNTSNQKSVAVNTAKTNTNQVAANQVATPVVSPVVNTQTASAYFGSGWIKTDACFWRFLFLFVLLLILLVRTFYLRGHKNGYYSAAPHTASPVVHKDDEKHIH